MFADVFFSILTANEYAYLNNTTDRFKTRQLNQAAHHFPLSIRVKQVEFSVSLLSSFFSLWWTHAISMTPLPSSQIPLSPYHFWCIHHLLRSILMYLQAASGCVTVCAWGFHFSTLDELSRSHMHFMKSNHQPCSFKLLHFHSSLYSLWCANTKTFLK